MSTEVKSKPLVVLLYSFVIVVASILIGTCTTSCSVVSKLKNKHYSKVDSTSKQSNTEVHKEKVDSSNITVQKSSGTQTTDSEYEKETVIEEYLSPYGIKIGDSAKAQKIDSGEWYINRFPLSEGGVYPIIKKTTIKEKGKTREIIEFITDHSQITDLSKSKEDSTSNKTKTEVKKKEETKQVQVVKKKVPVFGIALLFLGILLAIFLFENRSKIFNALKGYFTGWL